MQFDINAIFTAALTAAINEALKPLNERIAAIELSVKDSASIDLTGIDFVGAVEAIATRIADEVSEAGIEAHGHEYDHSDFVDSEALDDKVADAMSDYDIEDKVREAVSNLSFEVSVS